MYNIIFLPLYTLQPPSTKILVFIYHHRVGFLYSFYTPPAPSPLETTTLLSVSTCLFWFGLVCSFILGFVHLFFFIFHIRVILISQATFFRNLTRSKSNRASVFKKNCLWVLCVAAKISLWKIPLCSQWSYHSQIQILTKPSKSQLHFRSWC